MSEAGAAGRAGRPAADAGAGRHPWWSRRVVLGVTGGIAAYKSIQLARDLARYGALVDVVMTRSASEFVGPVSFEALTGRPVYSELIATGHALDHIRLAREADVICVAPATADFMARAAAGRADDLLTAVLLATRAPVIVCPAMNDQMWSHEQTQSNARHLRQLGYQLLGPAQGPLAFGEGSGPGRMEEPDTILEHIGRTLGTRDPWRGRSVVVTAGPTREAVDAVRVLSNRSSGRMGFAIAAAAWRRGADVTLITGPTQLPPPVGPQLVRVESAEEMLHAVRAGMAGADVLFMAAAVADFRPAHPAAGKIKKSAAPEAIALEAAPDVLHATHDVRGTATFIVGFALETDDALDNARRKLHEKNLDMIVLNSANEQGAGFDVETNHVVVVTRHGAVEDIPLMSKDDVAEALLDRVAVSITARA